MQHWSVSLDSFPARVCVIEQVASAVLIIPSFRDRVHAYVSTRIGVGSTNYYGPSATTSFIIIIRVQLSLKKRK